MVNVDHNVFTFNGHTVHGMGIFAKRLRKVNSSIIAAKEIVSTDS